MAFIGVIALCALLWIIWISVSAARASSRIEQISGQLEALEREIRHLKATQATEPQAATEAPTPTASVQPSATAEPPKPLPSSGWGTTSALPPATPAQVGVASEPLYENSERDGFERTIGTRWTVWVGGIAIALGAIFLVQYSIQQGYFGPVGRITLGVLLSTALLAAGEYSRRQPWIAALTEDRVAHIPPILTAVGLIAAYATTYAAYALYDMIGAAPAFMLLGGLSVAAMLLAGLHASYVGAIGLLGSVLAPALVHSETPKPEVLFLYLTFVLGAAFVTSDLRNWRWLDGASLVACAVWPLAWIVAFQQPGDEVIVGLHLLALYGLRFLLNWKPDKDGEAIAPLIGAHSALAGSLLMLLVFTTRYGSPSLLLLGIYALVSVLAAWRNERVVSAVAVSAPIVVIALAFWSIPYATWYRDPTLSITHYLTQPITPDAVFAFLRAAALAACLYGVGGYARLLRGHAHRNWPLASAFVPLILFAVAYARVTMFDLDIPWAAVALLLALLYGATTRQFAERLSDRNHEIATASYATATLGFLAMTFAITLRNEWLTVALALLVPGLAWIQAYLPLRMLERLALSLAGIVVIRLVFNPSVLHYDVGQTIIFNALLYSYGAPAAFLAWAAWFYRHMERDSIADKLESAALVLGMIMVNLEVNHAFNGGHAFAFSTRYDLAQHAVHLLCWLSASLALYLLNLKHARSHYQTGASILLVLSSIWFLAALTLENPLFVDEPIYGPLIFDALLLAYLIPSLIAGVYAVITQGNGQRSLALALGAASFMAGFTYYSLEIRRFFHTGRINFSLTPLSEAENYAFSAAWLLLGAGFLAAAFVLRSQLLRRLSLAIVMLVVIKVFLFDMAGLTGILRAMSFLGLGGALIGLGLFYQKFVFQAPSIEPSIDPSTDR